MSTAISRRSFVKLTGATATALALGPSRWSWAVEESPFGHLQDDPLIRLPEGFSYKIVAETGTPLTGGRGPYPRPSFPDLSVARRWKKGRLLLSTSHEMPAEFPFAHPPPAEDYDEFASGAITSLLLDTNFDIVESAYNVGGMLTNCSGSGTRWGTVLTGEETTADLGAPHGFIWEVDIHKNNKVRLDDCGRFEHETAVVDNRTGYVYLTEDDSPGLLYRMRPRQPGRLAKGGVLEAYSRRGWVRIPDPTGRDGTSPADQGSDRGALVFRRLEGGVFDGRHFYFTETQDTSACGKVWRLQVDTGRLELFAQGGRVDLCMPDNVVFDLERNVYVCEDQGPESRRNSRIHFIDRKTGKMAVFAEIVNPADEPTGPDFTPGGRALFLNLQRSGDFGVTIVIEGPFPRRRRKDDRAATPPGGAQPPEHQFLAEHSRWLPSLADMSLGAAAGLVALRRRGQALEIDRKSVV